MITKQEIEQMLEGLDEGRERFRNILTMASSYCDIIGGHYVKVEDHRARVEDKDATIRRLKEKLENQERYISEQHIDGWKRVQKALPRQSAETPMSLVDHVINEFNKLNAETGRLHDLWHKAEEALNVMRDRCDSLDNERSILQRWKNEAIVSLNKWDEVYHYLQNHKETHISDTAWVACMKFLRERDRFKASYSRLKMWIDSKPTV